MCGGLALGLGAGIANGGDNNAFFRAVVVVTNFFLPIVVLGILASLYDRGATLLVVLNVKLTFALARPL